MTGGGRRALKLDEFLPYRLNVCASMVSQALSRIYAEQYKIGVPEWRVLVTLGEYGMMTAKAVGLHSHMHKTKVSRAVALLERRKLVTRRANRADLREAFLSLTPAGRAIYDDLAPMALDFARRLMDTVDAADRAALDRALTILIERSAKIAAELANGTAHVRARHDPSGRAQAFRIAFPVKPGSSLFRDHALDCRFASPSAGSDREALYLFPLVRRLSRAHRAQSQGPAL